MTKQRKRGERRLTFAYVWGSVWSGLASLSGLYIGLFYRDALLIAACFLPILMLYMAIGRYVQANVGEVGVWRLRPIFTAEIVVCLAVVGVSIVSPVAFVFLFIYGLPPLLTASVALGEATAAIRTDDG